VKSKKKNNKKSLRELQQRRCQRWLIF